ncbi:MAG: riboflavin synthase [Candidatus Omnitrophota bacterium]
MFTGIVETSGIVKGWRKKPGRTPLLEIRCPALSRRVKTGGSIAVNGACLTVTKKNGSSLFFNVIGETKARTTLASLEAGDRVSLERSLKWAGRIEGHFVQGHVDGVGRVRRVLKKGAERSFLIAFPARLKPFIVEKGSVAVDGVSLTIGKTRKGAFWVHCIPHTLKSTNFVLYRAGTKVNVEADIRMKCLAGSGKIDKARRRV